ncbi:MAG: hypothetical protein QXX17_03940 [Conexivisphaerales archaeon]
MELYIYRVKKKDKEKFLKISKYIAILLKRLCAENSQLLCYIPERSSQRYTPLTAVYPISTGEEVWIELDTFADRENSETAFRRFEPKPEYKELLREYGRLSTTKAA